MQNDPKIIRIINVRQIGLVWKSMKCYLMVYFNMRFPPELILRFSFDFVYVPKMGKNRLKQIMKQTRVLSNVFAHDIWEYCVGAEDLSLLDPGPGPTPTWRARLSTTSARSFAFSAIYRSWLGLDSCRVAAVFSSYSAAAACGKSSVFSHRPTAEGEWDQLEQHWTASKSLESRIVS